MPKESKIWKSKNKKNTLNCFIKEKKFFLIPLLHLFMKSKIDQRVALIKSKPKWVIFQITRISPDFWYEFFATDSQWFSLRYTNRTRWDLDLNREIHENFYLENIVIDKAFLY